MRQKAVAGSGNGVGGGNLGDEKKAVADRGGREKEERGKPVAAETRPDGACGQGGPAGRWDTDEGKELPRNGERASS